MYDDGSIFPTKKPKTNYPWMFNFCLDGCEIQPETEDIYDIPVSYRRVIEEQGEEIFFIIIIQHVVLKSE